MTEREWLSAAARRLAAAGCADAGFDARCLLEDLGADSANLMMLIMDLENEFNITVEDEALGTIKTVGDVVAYIEKQNG